MPFLENVPGFTGIMIHPGNTAKDTRGCILVGQPSGINQIVNSRKTFAELTAALISQRYGLQKVIKEDSVPYLQNWLASIKEEPAYIKTVLQDVKKASHMIGQTIDKVQETIDAEEGRNSSSGISASTTTASSNESSEDSSKEDIAAKMPIVETRGR